jgi:hypothetical protein
MVSHTLGRPGAGRHRRASAGLGAYDGTALMPGPSRRLFVLALIGCFALAFGTAFVFESMLIWLLEIRLRLPYESVANFMVTMLRTVASLSIAVLLCIWLSRR